MNGEYISIETLRIIQSLENENKRLSTELEIEKDITDGMLETIDKAIKELEKLKKLYDDNYTVSDKVDDIIDILKKE